MLPRTCLQSPTLMYLQTKRWPTTQKPDKHVSYFYSDGNFTNSTLVHIHDIYSTANIIAMCSLSFGRYAFIIEM